MFYDIFSELCRQRGISCARAARELGLSNATPTKWKNSKATPDGSTLTKVAQYFGVSVDRLLGNEDTLEAALTDLRDNTDTRALLEVCKGMTPEQVRQMADFGRFLRGQTQADD